MSAEQRVELTVLMDAPEDGCVEERGWVPVELAPTEVEAVERLTKDVPIYEDGFAYQVIGRSHQRPDDHLGESGDYFIFEEDGPEERDGHKGYAMEFVTWRPCKPDAPGAVECWDLELVEPRSLADRSKEEGVMSQTIAPREAEVGDLVIDLQSNGRPHPLRSFRRVVSAGPKRLTVERTGGVLKGQREYVSREDLERLGPRIRKIVRPTKEQP